jgi:hypothetical protein
MRAASLSHLPLVLLVLLAPLLPLPSSQGQPGPAAGPEAATTAPETEIGEFYLLVEPRHLRRPLSQPYPGARDTYLTPVRGTGRAGRDALEAYREEEFKALQLAWVDFRERAARSADQLLRTIQPVAVRASDGEIRYLIFQSEAPVISALLLAPSLHAALSPILGDAILLSAPDHHRLFAFPDDPEILSFYGPDLMERYEAAIFPGSTEIFRLVARGEGEPPSPPQAIGQLSEQ